ncbi:DUF397 domain-containing protein [Bailinhaonella thermotolerans]|uniref:DUF397 domain-containing protein n=1 Tax=Bailinhaonella thermotolerans TaxID=1070861 RepID=A0A3A3ZZK5_9ACTN|nr:DUF397 domain-containing protein [Bailinhaonella thermotolerans]RJL20787.1 DUF397 domain-containing protein [Bailinhaonella thermotolerans]
MDESRERWRKSSRSVGSNNDCVEIARIGGRIAVRDSKDPEGPRLMFGVGEWRDFLVTLRGEGSSSSG